MPKVKTTFLIVCLTISGDRVKYVGGSVLVEADHRYLLGVKLTHVWFIGYLCHGIHAFVLKFYWSN